MEKMIEQMRDAHHLAHRMGFMETSEAMRVLLTQLELENDPKKPGVLRHGRRPKCSEDVLETAS